MACKNKSEFLSRLRCGWKLIVSKDSCRLEHPSDGSYREYDFGYITIIFILLQELGWEGDMM